MRRSAGILTLIILVALVMGGCQPDGGEYLIIVTATPRGNPDPQMITLPTAAPPVIDFEDDEEESTEPEPTPTLIPITGNTPTPDPPRPGVEMNDEDQAYMIMPGDTLGTIADFFNVSQAKIAEANGLVNPNVLEVGQELMIPLAINVFGPSFKIIPDSEFVYGPHAGEFNVTEALTYLPDCVLANYSEEVYGSEWTGPDIVERVALEQSLNPRLLLAILEYESGWLSNSAVPEESMLYPMGFDDRIGLYRQLEYAGMMLQTGYYGWKLTGLNAALLADGGRVGFDETLNAGTAGVQFLLAQTRSYSKFERAAGHEGFYQTYAGMFGDPFRLAVEPLIPESFEQPALHLPFQDGEEWYYTGGPHGGWGSQSAWAALDFVSRDEMYGCEIDPAFVAAMADGVIARSDYGMIILDLDGDGNPGTGWTIFYLHVSSEDRQVSAGDWVEAGDPLAHPSCEGGVSFATHVHVARRYNGEWISADCTGCLTEQHYPNMVMEDWVVYSFYREYDGSMIRGDDYREACVCREPLNLLISGE